MAQVNKVGIVSRIMRLVPKISLSGSQLLGLFIGICIGGMLLILAGMSLIASFMGVTLATPLFILFSPVLVPAAAALSLAVASVLTAGACGLVGLASFSWVGRYLRAARTAAQMQFNPAARERIEEEASYLGHKTKEVAQDIQTREEQPKGTRKIAF